MKDPNSAFGDDYDIFINHEITISFRGAGECGMGGPIHGTLSISMFNINMHALRPFYVEDTHDERFIGCQELIIDTPSVIIHILDRKKHEKRTCSIPFGAYAFKRIFLDSIVLVNEYTNTLLSFKIPQAFSE